MADALDRIVVDNMRVYPTHVAAARRMGLTCADSVHEPLARVMRAFDSRYEACPQAERAYWLGGYGNLIENRRMLGVTA